MTQNEKTDMQVYQIKQKEKTDKQMMVMDLVLRLSSAFCLTEGEKWGLQPRRGNLQWYFCSFAIWIFIRALQWAFKSFVI